MKETKAASSNAGWSRRIRRHPLVHFVLVGSLLFVLEGLLDASAKETATAAPAVIAIPPHRIRQQEQDFERRTGRKPDPRERAALLQREVDDEILYREALARRLDQGDPSIRYWLIREMRFLADDPDVPDAVLLRDARKLGLAQNDVVVRRILIEKIRRLLLAPWERVRPTDAELRGFVERNAARYLEPERVTFWHVFLNRDKRGSAVEREAGSLLNSLRTHPRPLAQAIRLGDPFLLGSHLRSRSRQGLIQRFGRRFAQEVMDLEPARWSDPIASPYGLHLVRVEVHEAAHLPEFQEIRSSVEKSFRAERRNQRFAQLLVTLRKRHPVRTKEPAPAAPE